MTDIIVNNEMGEREATFKSAHGPTVKEVLGAMSAEGILLDEDGFVVNTMRMILPPGTYTFRKKRQQHDGISNMLSAIHALRLEVHALRESLPTVLEGHVLISSQASQIPQEVVSSVFDSLGLSLCPKHNEMTYKLPDNAEYSGNEWKFDWKWPKNAGGGDDRDLERQSYGPVIEYLGKCGLFCVDVSEGQFCVEKLLFHQDIYTRRRNQANPMLVRGQTAVYHRHCVQGRTDLAVLRQDNEGGYILRNMVKFVIELKTVYGYQQTGCCMRECQLQLIGLNASNTNCSPSVVLSNLVRKHQVIYLDADEEERRYVIKVQDCDSFAAAIHFANVLSDRDCISAHFSRPTTPETSWL